MSLRCDATMAHFAGIGQHITHVPRESGDEVILAGVRLVSDRHAPHVGFTPENPAHLGGPQQSGRTFSSVAPR
jgi:hypothetical protein